MKKLCAESAGSAGSAGRRDVDEYPSNEIRELASRQEL
jgi:hypothetical protein